MKQWGAFWALGLIWGSSFLLIKIAVEDLGTFPLVSLRVGIAALLMAIYLGVGKFPLPRNAKDIRSIILVGIFNVALPFTLITRAEESIDSNLATILNSTVPLFSLIVAHFALSDERLNRYKILGLGIGYLGVVILTARGLNGTGNSPLEGVLMMLGASSSYGIAVVFIRSQLRHIPPMFIAGTSLIVGAVVIIPLTLLLADAPQHIGNDTIISILLLGLVNTFIAYFLFYHLIAEWGARATMVTYTFPPIGIILGAVFLQEPIDARLIFGAALILGGIFAVNYKGMRPPPKAATSAS